MKKFDPNAPEEKKVVDHEWATYVPYTSQNRHTKFKTHAKAHHATSACDWSREFQLFRKIDGQWVEIESSESKNRPRRCEYCLESFLDTDTIGWTWERSNKGRIVVPPRLVAVHEKHRWDYVR